MTAVQNSNAKLSKSSVSSNTWRGAEYLNPPRLPTVAATQTAGTSAPPPPPGPATASAGGPPPGPPPHQAPADTSAPGAARGAFARFTDAPAAKGPPATPANEPLPPSSALQARLFR